MLVKRANYDVMRRASFLVFYDLRGYRLFVRIAGIFNAFMFTKRANFDEMRKSYLMRVVLCVSLMC